MKKIFIHLGKLIYSIKQIGSAHDYIVIKLTIILARSKINTELSMINKITVFAMTTFKQNCINKIILDKLIKSCLDFNPSLFLPYLQCEKVVVDAIDKNAFYNFFKQMLLSAKDNSVEPMAFKIEKVSWENEENFSHYNLYDSVHKHSRLSIRVKESDSQIYLDIMPF